MEPALKSDNVIKAIRSRRDEIAKRFSVRLISVFGSTVRDEADADSDVDVLVDMTEPTFDHYMDLKFFLEDLLDKEVDLVLADTVKPRLRRRIEDEAVHV